MKVVSVVDLSLHLYPISQVHLPQVVLYNQNYSSYAVIFRFWKAYLQNKNTLRSQTQMRPLKFDLVSLLLTKAMSPIATC